MINDTHSIQESDSGQVPSIPQGEQAPFLITSSGRNTYFPRAPGPLTKASKFRFPCLFSFQKLNTNCLGSHFEEGASPVSEKITSSWMLHLFSLSPTLMTQGLMGTRENELHCGNLLTSLRHWQATDHMPYVPFIQLWGWVTSSRFHSHQGAKLV